MTCIDGDGIDIHTFDYDSQGRVVKQTENTMYDHYEHSATTTYTYGGNTIISKDTNEETHIYTLSNGQIIKDVEKHYGQDFYTYNYTYDSDGYLLSQILTSNDSSGKIEFTWTNGNLTKYSEVVNDIHSPYSDSYT